MPWLDNRIPSHAVDAGMYVLRQPPLAEADTMRAIREQWRAEVVGYRATAEKLAELAAFLQVEAPDLLEKYHTWKAGCDRIAAAQAAIMEGK